MSLDKLFGYRLGVKMKIVLSKNTLLATALTYEQACEALIKANKHIMAKEWVFTMVSQPNEKGWQLQARNKKLTKEFLDNPEEFVIEISDG